MFRDTMKKIYHGRWVFSMIVCLFVLAGGVYVINQNQQTITAARDARDAARAANASAASSARAAQRANRASCKAVTQVADTFNPFTAQFRLFLNFFLKDRSQSIERAAVAVKNAATPKQKAAALTAQKQLKESLGRFDALSKTAKQVGPLSC